MYDNDKYSSSVELVFTIGCLFEDHDTILELINPTNYQSNKDTLLKRSAHILTLSETALPTSAHRSAQAVASQNNWILKAGPTCPESTTNEAGVAALSRKPRRTVHLKPKTQEYQQAEKWAGSHVSK